MKSEWNTVAVITAIGLSAILGTPVERAVNAGTSAQNKISQNGSISGRILSEDSTPAAGVRVAAQSERSSASEPAATLLSLTHTDATGYYRLDGVPPGRYYVVTGRLDNPIYFPGVLSSTAAGAITVQSGAVAENINFRLPRMDRIGDVARQLSDQDLREIELLLSSKGKRWLLVGDPGQQANQQWIQAYLSPEFTTRELRRGSVLLLMRQQVVTPGAANTWMPWNIVRSNQPPPSSGTYAQVAIPGRTFDQIDGDQDLHRPFVFSGRMDDATLVSLANHMRRNPNTFPIKSVERKPDDSVVVWLRRGNGSSQVVTLRQQGNGWIVVSSSVSQA